MDWFNVSLTLNQQLAGHNKREIGSPRKRHVPRLDIEILRRQKMCFLQFVANVIAKTEMKPTLSIFFSVADGGRLK